MIEPGSQEELPLAQMPHRGDPAGRPRHGLVLTVGHSTRSLEEFIGLLRAHEVGLLADVRAFPRSRRNPQFNVDTLPEALRGAGILYRHFPALGGRRATRPDSTNVGWREPGFRGFADYMETRDFADGLAALRKSAATHRVALMCAEAQPWRCHRSLISDALLAHGVQVEHILGAGSRRPHRLPPFARVSGTTVTYPAVLTE